MHEELGCVIHKTQREVKYPGKLLTRGESRGDLRGNERVSLEGAQGSQDGFYTSHGCEVVLPVGPDMPGGLSQDHFWEGKLGD